MSKIIENNKISSDNKYVVDPELILYRFSNLENKNDRIYYETSKKFIQFHFSLKGTSKFIYHGGRYILPLKNEFSLLFHPHGYFEKNLTQFHASYMLQHIMI